MKGSQARIRSLGSALGPAPVGELGHWSMAVRGSGFRPSSITNHVVLGRSPDLWASLVRWQCKEMTSGLPRLWPHWVLGLVERPCQELGQVSGPLCPWHSVSNSRTPASSTDQAMLGKWFL